MPPIAREAIALFAGLFGAGLAGFVLADARAGNWAFFADPAQIERWQSSVPSAIAVGVVVAVLVCILLGRLRSRRGAWSAVVVFGLIVGVATVVRHQIADLDVVTALNYLRSVAAGGLLGGVVAALWARGPGRIAVTMGAVAAFLLAKAWNSAGAASGVRIGTAASQLGDPPTWLIVVAVVLAFAAAWTAQAEFRLRQPDARSLRVAIVAAVVLVVLHRLLGQWIGDQDSEPRIRQWVVIAIALVIVLAVVEIIARRVSELDGRFLLTATGITAAAMPVLTDFGAATMPAEWIVLVGVVAVVIGLRLSVDRPHPVAGLLVAAVVPLLDLVWPGGGHDGVWLLVRVGVLGLGVAHAVGSTFAAEPAFGALGLALPFAGFVIARAAQVPLSHYEIVGESFTDLPYTPLTGAPTDRAYSTGLSIEFTDLTTQQRLIGVAMLAVVAFCATGILTLRRRPEMLAG